MAYHIYLALGAFLFSLLGTRLAILALRQSALLMDKPNARSNHRKPTPRGGGIALVFSLIIFLLAADASYWLVIGLAMLAIVSLLDDMIGLAVITRLTLQIFIVLVMLTDNPLTLFDGAIPAQLDRIVLVLAWVWFINLFNFMDGIDGISAVEMISIGTGLCLVLAFSGQFDTPLSIYSLLMVSVGSGFIWWNWSPAKIFLGDVGSVPIGFMLGYLLLLSVQKGAVIDGQVTLYPALILPAYYVADGTYTLVSRMVRKEKFWQAHTQHFYQRAVRAGRSHSSVAREIFGVNILLVCLALFSVISPEVAWFNLLVAYAMVAFVLRHFARTPKVPRKA